MNDDNPSPEPDDESDLPLNANGPAYTHSEDRHGVPLNYVAEKLDSAIEELHSHALRHPGERDSMLPVMYYLLVAHLGLHNMLGKANDRSLAQRLLSGSSEDLQAWLRLVAREGDVQGLAELERDDLEHPPVP